MTPFAHLKPMDARRAGSLKGYSNGASPISASPPNHASRIEPRQRFDRGALALDRLSLSAPAIIVYGLLGPDGAGTTTLIRLLATLVHADSGVVHVAGLDIRREAAAVRR
jgi:ABC-type uncharacterized transport system ATPase subunit